MGSEVANAGAVSFKAGALQRALTRFRPRVLNLPVYSFIIGIIGAVVLVGPLVHAKFGPIDDHELIAMLGPDYRLPLGEVPAEILKTEVGMPGETGRYRPVLYTVRVLEASFWGANAGPYYAFRVLLFAGLFGGLVWAASAALGPILGTLFGGIVIGLPFWHDVWPRLAANEQFASFGLILFLVGLVQLIRILWERRTTSWSAGLAWMSTGLIVAAGSKENFIFLGLPVLAFTIVGLRRRMLRPWSVGLAAAGVGLAAIVAISVLAGVLHLGMDLHGQSAGSRSKAFGVFFAQFLDPSRSPFPYHQQMFVSMDLLRLSLATLLLSVPLIYGLWRFVPLRDPRSFPRTLKFVLVIVGVSLVWLVWEIVFYRGDWPTGMRYDFPGILIFPIGLGGTVVLLRRWLSSPVSRGGLDAALVAAGVLAWQTGALPLFTGLRDAVAVDVQRTSQFDNDLRATAATVAERTGWPIFVEVGYPMDYEPALTLPIWLRWKGVTNPLFLRVHEATPGSNDDKLMNLLYSAMRSYSTSGGHDYAPLGQLDGQREAKGECFTLSYTGPAAQNCVVLSIKR